MNYLHSSLKDFSSPMTCKVRKTLSDFLRCAAKTPFLEDLVEGGHDSKREGPKQTHPCFLKLLKLYNYSEMVLIELKPQYYTDLLCYIPKGCLPLLAVTCKG